MSVRGQVAVSGTQLMCSCTPIDGQFSKQEIMRYERENQRTVALRLLSLLACAYVDISPAQSLFVALALR